jgi:tetratricopeptide (TPR) repeat protein
MRKEIVMLKRGGYLLGICAICLFITSLPLFAEDPADSLYAQAKTNENLRKYEEAKAAYQQIIEQYPNSPAAENAGLRLSQCNALEFLAAGNDAAAQLVIAAAEKNFANHADLPWFLCRIASEYETLRKHDQARSLYEQVFRQYPDSPAAKNARLELVRYEVLSLAAAGKDAEVQSEITKAKTEFAGRRELPVFIYSIANQYKKLKKPDQAKALFGQIIQQYPNRSVAKGARMELLKYKIQSLVAAGKDAEVQSEIIKAKNDPSSPAGHIILFIGEEYYSKAQNASGQGKAAAEKAEYEKAIAILETNLDLASAVSKKCSACYVTGLCYQQIGEYLKAASAFENAYAADPKFIYAEYCLFAVGNCHEKLLKQSLVSETDGIAVIRGVYTQFLQTYPDSESAPHVREWLKNNLE